MSETRQSSATIRWIKSADIKNIEGAHKPSAYVARAYAYQKKHGGELPDWAQKSSDGSWLFDEAYIVSCARENLDTIGISEAARVLGVTRRTIQTWVDSNVIPVSEHRPGETRRILRAPFLEAIPALRRRLETAPVVGYRIKHGLPVEEQVRQRIDDDRARRETHREQSRTNRARRETRARLKARLEKKAADKEARLALRMNRQLETAESRLNDIRKRKSAIEREVRQREEQEKLEVERARAIRIDFEARLAESARATEKLRTQKQRAQQKLERHAGQEAEAMATVEELRKAVSEQLDQYRRQSAQAIASQLREAREAAESGEKPGTEKGESSHRVKRSAEAVASRLREAHDACVRTAALEAKAVELATGIVDDMPEGNMERIDGAILFNDIAEQRGIPSDIRIKVTRQFFSRRT
jgi:excisionase family DNA binding protein